MTTANRAPKPIDWVAVRAGYEGGADVSRLAQIHNIKARLIRERAASESWPPSVGEQKHLEVQEQKRAERLKRLAAAGVFATLPPEQRAALVNKIAARYIAGDSMEDICRETGATRAVIYHAVFGGADDLLHREAITQVLIARVARADELLEEATEPAQISRAREMARFARMDLERRRPALYGQQARHEHVVALPDMGERLRRARERIGEEHRAQQAAAALPAPEALE